MADLTVGRVSFGPTGGAEFKVSVDKYLARSPRPVRWHPQPDITAHELALAMPALLMLARVSSCIAIEEQVEALPKEVRRHFVTGEA